VDDLSLDEELSIEGAATVQEIEEMEDLDASLAPDGRGTPAATEGLPLIETDALADLASSKPGPR